MVGFIAIGAMMCCWINKLTHSQYYLQIFTLTHLSFRPTRVKGFLSIPFVYCYCQLILSGDSFSSTSVIYFLSATIASPGKPSFVTMVWNHLSLSLWKTSSVSSSLTRLWILCNWCFDYDLIFLLLPHSSLLPTTAEWWAALYLVWTSLTVDA